MRGIAIDPGPIESHYLFFDVDWTAGEPIFPPYGVRVVEHDQLTNEDLLRFLASPIFCGGASFSFVERMVAGLGNVGSETMATQWWGGAFFGRLTAQTSARPAIPSFTVTPLERRIAVLGSARGNDSSLRAELLRIYGEQQLYQLPAEFQSVVPADAAIGKKCPTCKGKGTRGKRGIPCDVCVAGFIIPKGPLYGFTGTHSFSTLAIAIAGVAKYGKKLGLEAKDA